MTRPFNTATPDNAMNPTPADIDSGISRSHNASTPPVSASGTPLKIATPARIEPNAKNRSARMMMSATGTTTLKRCAAETSCSKVPPYSIQ